MDTFKKILDDVDEVDLTPMIDVTFLLLIYFMVTTMIKQPEAELSAILPGKAASDNFKETPPVEEIDILDNGFIQSRNNIAFGDGDTDLAQSKLIGYLKSRNEQVGGKLEVKIYTDPLASWQAPLSALNACEIGRAHV